MESEKAIFTTTNIKDGLQIPFGRLREWIVNGYIKPTNNSDGQGKPAYFTLSDIYEIELFRILIDNKFSRERAAAFIKGFRNLEEKRTKINSIIFRKTDKGVFPKAIINIDKWFLDLRSGKNISKDEISLIGARSDEISYDSIFIINFKKIRDKVNLRMSK